MSLFGKLRDAFASRKVGADAAAIDPSRIARVLDTRRSAGEASVNRGTGNSSQPSNAPRETVAIPQRRVGQINLHLSPAERMIAWLAAQPAEIVDAAAQALNWDESQEVIHWIVSQPTTDAATALKLFLRTEPAFYAGEDATQPEDSVAAIIEAFVANWTTNRYARGGVAYDPSEVSEFGSSDVFFINELEDIDAKARPTGHMPWPPLHGLKGPFQGSRPRDIADYFKHDKEALFHVRFLFECLGSLIVSGDIDEEEYIAWRRSHGAGDDGRAVYDMVKDDLPNIKRKLSE